MSERTPEAYLEDIRTSVEKIGRYVDGMDLDDFSKDDKTSDAVIRNLEVIGEAINKISRDYQEDYPNIPWTEIISMRNKIVHEYFGVDLEVVWGTIKNDLSYLEQELKKIEL